MNNTKLKSLVNKLVQIEIDSDHLKGFLFKSGSDYFIKPIEVYKGEAVEAGRFYITEDNADFVEFCESPKLMKVSMKSWHYRLMKWILQSNVPTPQTLQNGCPYFWLLVFSLLVTPFVAIWRGFIALGVGLGLLFWKINEKLAYLILKVLPEERVIDIENRSYPGNYYDLPFFAKIHVNRNGNLFVAQYLKYKYGIDSSSHEYYEKRNELEKKYKDWRENCTQKEVEEAARDREKARLKEAKKQRLHDKRRARKAARTKFWKPFNEKTTSAMLGISKAIQFKDNKAKMIKFAKSIVGILITIIGLCITTWFAIVGTAVISMIIDGLIWLFTNYWEIVSYVLLGVWCLFLLIILIKAIQSWIQTILIKYKTNKKIWYVQFLMYIIVYPIKYLFKFIMMFGYYLIYIPLKFIFYDILYEYVIVNFAIFIWGIMKTFSGFLIGSLGIFGEYFGASKKDYCPGIEWVDTDNE